MDNKLAKQLTDEYVAGAKDMLEQLVKSFHQMRNDGYQVEAALIMSEGLLADDKFFETLTKKMYQQYTLGGQTADDYVPQKEN